MNREPLQITTEGTTGATWLAALFRGLLNAVVMGGGATLTTYLTLANVEFDYQGQSISVPQADRWEMALIIGGIAFFTALGFRGAGEGSYDAKRQANGEVKSSDVTPNPPAMVITDTNV